MKKSILFISSLIIFAVVLIYTVPNTGVSANKAGCEVYVYIANNSIFEINIMIDGFPEGHILLGTNKTYTLELNGDIAKRMKVNVKYQDPDYIEMKSFNLMTKKLECGQTDSIYVSINQGNK